MIDIKEYWPPILQEIKEFQKIAEIENPELTKLWQEIESIVDDQFIETATERGIARREKILNVIPFADDTLESRRFRVRGLWNEKLPYTYRVLLEKLENLCGEDGYKVILNAGEYTICIKVAIVAKRMIDAVKEITNRMLPANLAINVELLYRQHITLGEYTHEYLGQYTHYDLREEVI